MILQGVYNALSPAFDNKGILTFSGFQERTRVPFIHLSKIITNFETRDTCLSRIESNLIQISLFSNRFTDFNDDLSTVRNLLLYKKIDIPDRRLTNIEELELIRSEPVKGLYQGVFQYDITTQKEITPFEIRTVEAPDLFTALYDRYTDTILSAKTSDFVTTRYGETELPFLFIPRYNKTNESLTTCTRIDSVDFTINFESHNFEKVEELTEDIDNIFSYSRFKLTGNDKAIDLDWLGNSFSEKEPGLWESSTRFRCLLESNIG